MIITSILSSIFFVLSTFGFISSTHDLVAREAALKPPIQRIASLQRFSLESASDFGKFIPHLPLNEDDGTFSQIGGDLPSLQPLLQKDIFTPLTVDASAVLAVDVGTKALLYQFNENEPRVLASLTKLATALVLVEQDPNWDEYVEILPSDLVGGESVKFPIGDGVTMNDLFFATLVGSANNAAVALVRGSGLAESAVVELMNEKAHSLGLEQTEFVDVTGLGSGNRSTVREFAVFVSNAFANQKIFDAVSSKRYVVKTRGGSSRTILTTNWLLRDDRVVAGKTGYTDEAGYNLAALSQYGNRTIVTLVFGAPSQEARFTETEKLIDWMKRNYEGWE